MNNQMTNNGGNMMGSNINFMEIIKMQVLSKMMITNGNENGQTSSIWNYIMFMLAEKMMLFLPFIIDLIKRWFENFIKKKKEYIEDKIAGNLNPDKKRTILSSITFDITNNDENLIGSSLLDVITNHPNTTNILYTNKNYILNSKVPILIDDYQEIYSKMKSDVVESSLIDKEQKMAQIIEVYSYKLSMDELRTYINKINHEYKLKQLNRFGNTLYFFSEIPVQALMGTGQEKDYSKLPPNITFSMKPFNTNRKFSNIYGHETELIKQRVNFFKNNRKWYDDKGIPYTLGLILSGNPGTGKTSSIKSIANETKRHIININFHNDLSKSQLENLFFNEFVSVTANGKTEYINIPINKRLYVLEDVDCQNNLVLQRTNKISSKNTNIDSNKLTLSVLLNLLDGVLETPGRILIMTSNYPKKLDSALIRPGRIDLIIEFTNCTNITIIEMIENFYEIKLNETDLKKINALIEYNWTPAELTKILFENFSNYLDAINILVEQDGKYIIDRVEESIEESTIKESPVKSKVIEYKLDENFKMDNEDYYCQVSKKEGGLQNPIFKTEMINIKQYNRAVAFDYNKMKYKELFNLPMDKRIANILVQFSNPLSTDELKMIKNEGEDYEIPVEKSVDTVLKSIVPPIVPIAVENKVATDLPQVATEYKANIPAVENKVATEYKANIPAVATEYKLLGKFNTTEHPPVEKRDTTAYNPSDVYADVNKF